MNKKGVVLFIVLGMLLIVLALAATMLGIVNSQSRFTFHQTSRIQAYYAAQAGMNYAIDQLRSGGATGWTIGTSCWTTPCELPADAAFPSSIQSIRINIIPETSTACNAPAPAGGACIQIAATYRND